MGKKLLNSSVVYFIGMALIIVGLLCPIVKNHNVFDLVNFKKFNTLSVGALLIAIGAILGIVFALLDKATKTNKLIALAISLVGGVVLVLFLTGVISDNKVAGFIQKKAGGAFIKNAYIGFYVILAGWVVAIYGWVTGK